MSHTNDTAQILTASLPGVAMGVVLSVVVVLGEFMP